MLSEPREALPRTSTFRLSAGQPELIDLTTVYQDNSSPLHTHGIYEINGGALRYCIAAPGLPRPMAFATKAGDGCTLVVLRHVGRPRPDVRPGEKGHITIVDPADIIEVQAAQY